MHNHIFQPKKGESPIVAGCPACAKINPDRMDVQYAIDQKFLVSMGR